MGNIIGWGHNKFGRNDTQSTEDMIAEVVSEAISHAPVSYTHLTLPTSVIV